MVLVIWLSGNPNEIHLLEQNMDKIYWEKLSGNRNAMHLLEQNIEVINWFAISTNPAIFEIDYEYIKSKIKPFEEELIQTSLHPARLEHYLDTYNYDIGDAFV